MADLNFKKITNKLPKCKDGRIDYTDSKVAFVINAILIHNSEILILKRSDKVATNKNSWDCIGGYCDENTLPINILKKELKEEINLNLDYVDKIEELEIIEINDEKKWIIYPFIVYLNSKPKIQLDWEHTEYKWVNKNEVPIKIKQILNSPKKTH